MHGETHAILNIRKQIVGDLVNGFASSFSTPTSDGAALDETNTEMVVLMTGGTGSLDGHCVHIWKEIGVINTIGENKNNSKKDGLVL